MKAVIVQVGEPKSIALLNNGRVIAVPTPEDARVGMELDVSVRRSVAWIALGAAVALILCAGIALGVIFFHRGEGDTSGYSYHKGERAQTEQTTEENAHGEEAPSHGERTNPWRK